ncbi:hypothetical protein NG895_29320 [Aeoliella sp. ICT_H6.2]|uniref:Uncharacterized protein n=1 Tax=Aeoliella straminimaris TaxID=2954799 RepID=A0A9X2FGN4_9BACT|nr:hypothetical protein [Aeoliella straminimaris]MCO6048023.1 hypothetical protein [Aeoliella straminimaris]
MQDDTPPEPGSFAPYIWPLIVIGLLLGHAFLMMIALTLATADPPQLVEGAPYTGAPKAASSDTP